MGWEKNRRYYTRSRRTGGRVIREYVGCGPVAELASAMDAAERVERERSIATKQELKADLRALDVAVGSLCDRAELLARVALLAAGYHQHKRGEWRKQRVQQR